MSRRSLLVLNIVLALLVVVGVPTFTIMPPAVSTIWTLTTVVLAGFVVYQGIRRFFSSNRSIPPGPR